MVGWKNFLANVYKLGNENIDGIFFFFSSVLFFFFFYVIKCVQMSGDDLFWYFVNYWRRDFLASVMEYRWNIEIFCLFVLFDWVELIRLWFVLIFCLIGGKDGFEEGRIFLFVFFFNNNNLNAIFWINFRNLISLLNVAIFGLYLIRKKKKKKNIDRFGILLLYFRFVKFFKLLKMIRLMCRL